MKKSVIAVSSALLFMTSLGFAASASDNAGCSLQSGSWVGSYQVHIPGKQPGLVKANIMVKGNQLSGSYTAGSEQTAPLYGKCSEGGSIVLNGGRLSGNYGPNQIHLSNALINVELSKAKKA